MQRGAERTSASRARRAERLRAWPAGFWRREGDEREAIWETAENLTPTGRPQRRDKDARRRRAQGRLESFLADGDPGVDADAVLDSIEQSL
jgi:hypothetical protein